MSSTRLALNLSISHRVDKVLICACLIRVLGPICARSSPHSISIERTSNYCVCVDGRSL